MTSKTRNAVVACLAGMIHEVKLNHPTRVGIDGVDCSGKTRLADELVEPLNDLGREVMRVSIDGFHNPKSIRYRRGRRSPAGFYRDTFDVEAIVRCVLEPLGPNGNRQFLPRQFDFKTDLPVDPLWQEASADSVVLFDGIFIHRPELLRFWDFTIFVEADFDETLRRAEERDGYLFGNSEDVEAIYKARYIPGQKLYLESEKPRDKANVVLDNNDFMNPVLTVKK